ncbi:MAG TPA: class I SAM-dependent methyltransferase [Opitutaceae bacterium]|nr:class I SAM-dependent methyltransferase [Opitutaceae bacterium]
MKGAPKDIVRAGYDALGSSYREHFASLHRERYATWLRKFRSHVPLGGRIVELGCADGIPVALELVKKYRYVGVELSPVQATAARRQVPSGEFLVEDMTEVVFPETSLDGVVALYSVLHIPLDEQPALFRRIYSWLRPGAVFMAVVGATRWTGTAEDWIRSGTTMYWSHGSGDDYEVIFREIGFEILEQCFVPEGNLGHTFMLLKRPIHHRGQRRQRGGDELKRQAKNPESK